MQRATRLRSATIERPEEQRLPGDQPAQSPSDALGMADLHEFARCLGRMAARELFAAAPEKSITQSPQEAT